MAQDNLTDQATSKELASQAEQMYGKTDAHAPSSTPVRYDFREDVVSSIGAAAQGPNLSTEQKEFAAANEQNKGTEELPVELSPAPLQGSEDPSAVAGKVGKSK